MRKAGRVEFGIEWSDFEPDRLLSDLAESLARRKYSQDDYNRKRC
jgi:hypothetical protein